MSNRRIDLHDVLFGGFLILVAAGAMAATRNLTVGTAADMGPGYMPLLISLLVLAFGVFFVGRGLLSGRERGIEAGQLRPILAICASVIAFALLAERGGLVIASIATILIAGLGGREQRLVESVVFAAVLTGCAVLLFVNLLSLPVPVWPRW